MNDLIIQGIPASSLDEFKKSCDSRGLVPTEITPGDVMQTISIRHNALEGILEWKVEKIGEQAIGLMVDVISSMWKYWFKQPLRPRLTSGHARVLIDLDGDSLKIVYGLTDPNNPEVPMFPDAPVAKMMLVSALFGLCEKTDGPDFDPQQALLGIEVGT